MIPLSSNASGKPAADDTDASFPLIYTEEQYIVLGSWLLPDTGSIVMVI